MDNTERRPHGITIGLSLLATIVLALSIYVSNEHNQRAHRFSIQVLAADDNATAIEGASVGLGIVQVPNETTDSNGKVFFSLPSESVGRPARITVNAEGFTPVEEQLILEPRDDYYRVLLHPVQKKAPVYPPERSSDAASRGSVQSDSFVAPSKRAVPRTAKQVIAEINAKREQILSQAHPTSVFIGNSLIGDQEIDSTSHEYTFEVHYKNPYIRFTTFRLQYLIISDRTGAITSCRWSRDTGIPAPGTQSGHPDGCLNLFANSN